MKISQPIHCRITLALHKGQNRIRITEEEFTNAAMEGIRDPNEPKRFVMAFSRYEDVRSGMFAYFSEAYSKIAMKEWHIDVKEN